MPRNQAAWLVKPKSHPLDVAEAPYNPPAADEIVLRSSAIAINPVDWKQQDVDLFIPSYPAIIGCDVAGVVEEVGERVIRFKKGDTVISNAPCLIKGKEYGAFQQYVKTPANVSCKIPSGMDPEQAVVLPLAVNTAGIGLFGTDGLGLATPSVKPPFSSNNDSVFIYGGSTSVGSTAIQLAKASGVQVVTTASKRNHEHCQMLGADAVIDYTERDWVDQAIRAIAKKHLVGVYDAVSHEETIRSCAELLAKVNAEASLVTTNPPPADIVSKTVFGANVTLDEKLAQAIWVDFLEPALAQGRLIPQPSPRVIGHGLDKIQDAMDQQRRGVSAVKLVVKLDL